VEVALDDFDAKYMCAVYAMRIVVRRTGIAATGYHLGAAVKVVIPNIDCIVVQLRCKAGGDAQDLPRHN
jgi:hypothetical protein